MRLACFPALTFAALLIIAACGNDDTADPNAGGPTICQPGDTVYCPCPDGSGKQGKRICSSTGRSFGPCSIDCQSVIHCDPGLYDPCSCDDGSIGTQLCLDDGASYGACEQCGVAAGGNGGSGQGGDSGSGGASGDAGTSGSAGQGGGPVDDADVCPGIPVALSPDLPVQFKGSTSAASNDDVGAKICASTVGGDHVYTVTPSDAGLFTARLTPQSYDGALYLRGPDCSGEQLACSDAATGAGAETLSLVVDAGQPYHLFVDGVGSGAYTLDMSLVTTWCGDGKATKPEACDDGNNAAGDGCAPDCTVEQNPPDVDCPGVAVQIYKGQPPLVVSGTTKGYTNKFTGPDYCPLGPTGEKSPDRVYRVVTDATGTLRARITSAGFDSLIYSRQGDCATPDPAGSGVCQDLEGINQIEEINVPVTAGQPTWIIIDGYSPLAPAPPESGTFALELSVL